MPHRWNLDGETLSQSTMAHWKNVVAASIFACIVAPSSRGVACGNEVDAVLSHAVRASRRAERLVQSGHLRRALPLAGRARRQAATRPEPRPWEFNTTRRQILARLDRSLAIITVRLRGAVNERRTAVMDEASDEHRRTQIAWATQLLAGQLADEPDDPVLIARVAEALLLGEAPVPHATLALQSLADRDLMPDTRGYATLAQLHAELGDVDARDAALARCRARANRAERGLCRVSDPA